MAWEQANKTPALNTISEIIQNAVIIVFLFHLYKVFSLYPFNSTWEIMKPDTKKKPQTLRLFHFKSVKLVVYPLQDVCINQLQSLLATDDLLAKDTFSSLPGLWTGRWQPYRCKTFTESHLLFQTSQNLDHRLPTHFNYYK